VSFLEEKIIASKWFETLRDQICAELEKVEQEVGSNAKFQRKTWARNGGGSGEMSFINGEVFEKAGVNISTVHGEFDPKFSKEIPGTENSREFWASGISLVIHTKSPLVPIVHMNTRMIVTEKLWFGGGADLTPVFPDPIDTADFHSAFKNVCDEYDMEAYAKYSKWCDEYFYLPHRSETRGVGGIFFDYINSGDWNKDFNFVKNVGVAFREIYPTIVRKSYKKTWNEEQREAQLLKRGRYVEFNLLYDRGTRFGLMTNGNTEAILMSMPPEVKWKIAA
jgi:coproporphyrinogen III oxidase